MTRLLRGRRLCSSERGRRHLAEPDPQAGRRRADAVGGIADIIHIDASINVGVEDVKTVISEPGKAMMNAVIASGPRSASKAAATLPKTYT